MIFILYLIAVVVKRIFDGACCFGYDHDLKEIKIYMFHVGWSIRFRNVDCHACIALC
jgi:hypothetical protein